MGAIHSLDILLRVPVMLNEDDSVSTSQIETETTDTGSQEQGIVGRVRVELVDNVLTLLSRDRTVEAHELNARKQLLEHSGLNHVKHLLHLTEDESAMLRDSLRQVAVGSR
jgi:hypothetical protein